jgi:hypothetical protein
VAGAQLPAATQEGVETSSVALFEVYAAHVVSWSPTLASDRKAAPVRSG